MLLWIKVAVVSLSFVSKSEPRQERMVPETGTDPNDYSDEVSEATTWIYEREDLGPNDYFDDMNESPKREILLWRSNLNFKLFDKLKYHTRLCGDTDSCAAPFSVEPKPYTCCSCSCDEDCFDEGSCCLAMYEDLNHMQTDQQYSR